MQAEKPICALDTHRVPVPLTAMASNRLIASIPSNITARHIVNFGLRAVSCPDQDPAMLDHVNKVCYVI